MYASSKKLTLLNFKQARNMPHHESIQGEALKAPLEMTATIQLGVEVYTSQASRPTGKLKNDLKKKHKHRPIQSSW